MIIVDSDVLIENYERRSERGAALFTRLEVSGQEVMTSAICLHEVNVGLFLRGREPIGLGPLTGLPFTSDDAKLSARLEADLISTGSEIGRTDTMIAAQAIRRGASLATFNQRHFARLEDHGLTLF